MKKLKYIGLSPTQCPFVGLMHRGESVEVSNEQADILLNGLFEETNTTTKTEKKSNKRSE